MNAADIAAYIGAAAWLPQIGGWIHGHFVAPLITIIPATEAEIGFTTYGPIFNIRMAMSSDRKDAIIDGFELTLRHADGESRTLRWSGLYETFSEISDAAGNTQVVRSRDQEPIALKIGTESLVEKFVRFQEPRYHETLRPLLTNLIAHFNFVKESGDPDYVSKILASKELHAVLEARKAAFWWKPGRYDLEINLSSPTKVALKGPGYFFVLTPVDIAQLRRNLTVIDTQLRDVIQSNLPDFQAAPINWNWATARVSRAEPGTALIRK
jgi:hypothetical protein